MSPQGLDRKSAAAPAHVPTPAGEGTAPVRVFVVEPSEPLRHTLVGLIGGEPALVVVGEAASTAGLADRIGASEAAIVFFNGPIGAPGVFEAIRAIMIHAPRPIVVGTTTDSDDDTAFRALEAGAVACVADPVRSRRPAGSARGDDWLQTLVAMAEVRVVTRRLSDVAGRGAAAPGRIRMVVIGASTGGPIALQQILAALPGDFPVPLLVVQHIARGFLPGMADWLRKTVGLRIQIAAHGLQPLAGHIYIAPDDFELGLGLDGRLTLSRPDMPGRACPSVAHLFRSAAGRYGPDVIGVLLTGMGRDGAAELRAMRDGGATTIAQDRPSSVVHGMPGAAIALGGACHVLPLDRIATMLVELVRRPPAIHGRHADGMSGGRT